MCFHLAVVTLTFKILSGHILETVRCRKLILDELLVGDCRYAQSWCDL